ncbi:MAG TPA: hypothetical protein VFG30_11475 [Polyangiales bacterium]|jgi:hypothetical protein|nr:hypothetical protein [Polyangiales bacterium]
MMITRAQSVLFSVIAATGCWMFAASPASAELSACGGIFLSGDASCGYKPKEECMTECMTVAVEESCVSEVYNECETECTTTASTECESTCTTSCVNNCTTTTTTENPPSCMDLCVADCDSDGGDGACGSATHKGPCGRCQKFNCNKRCEARCGDDPEPAKVTTTTECMPTCTNACMASCTAKVNTQCQVDCQERTYTKCEQKMVQQCETQCEDKGGAIFCDGQFVNAADVHNCADELKVKVKIDIDIDAALDEAGETVDKAARDVSKTVDKNVDTKCSVTNVGSNGTRGTSALIALPLIGVALWRSRRRNANKR